MASTDIRTPIWAAAVIAAMVCGAMVFSNEAMAQPGAGRGPGAAPTEAQAITVTPEVVRTLTGERQGKSRIPVEIVSTSRQVSFADLDLATPEGQAQLRQRIRDAARDSCRELVRAAPLGRTHTPEASGCERNASRAALALVDDLAAAEK